MDRFEELNYRGLQALAKKNGVKANGSKGELKTRLAAALQHDDTATDESSTLRGGSGTTATADESGICCTLSDDIPDANSKVIGGRAQDISAAPQPNHVVDHEAQEVSEGRKNEPLFANKESRAVSKTPRETRVKKPTARPGLRFERMHQTLFAGQTSIERYGKTPKKTVRAKENMPLSKEQPFSPMPTRPAAGSGVQSAKRGVTIASKPPTLVVQRSTKKPTKVKEFQLSGKREAFTFRPYSGPVRPITPGSKTASFNVGYQSKQAHDHSGPKGIKSTLASGRAQVSRRNAKIENAKTQREKKLQAQRGGC